MSSSGRGRGRSETILEDEEEGTDLTWEGEEDFGWEGGVGFDEGVAFGLETGFAGADRGVLEVMGVVEVEEDKGMVELKEGGSHFRK